MEIYGLGISQTFSGPWKHKRRLHALSYIHIDYPYLDLEEVLVIENVGHSKMSLIFHGET